MFVEIKKCNIKDLREKRGVSAYRIAKLLGHSNQSSISRIEGGYKLPSLKTAIALAKILNCKITDLYDYEIKED